MALDDYVEALAVALAVAGALPVLPVVLAAVDELRPEARAPTLRRAFLTSTAVSFVTMVVAGPILRFLGVALDDLRIAGGVVLLTFAVHDLLFSRAARKQAALDNNPEFASEEDDDPAIVPLAIPILFGPAGMAGLTVLFETRPTWAVMLAFATNAVLNALLLANADWLARRVGRGVMRTAGKVMGLVLAGLAVSMLRVGIQNAVALAG